VRLHETVDVEWIIDHVSTRPQSDTENGRERPCKTETSARYAIEGSTTAILQTVSAKFDSRSSALFSGRACGDPTKSARFRPKELNMPKSNAAK
jgi:hypothetical protein